MLFCSIHGVQAMLVCDVSGIPLIRSKSALVEEYNGRDIIECIMFAEDFDIPYWLIPCFRALDEI